MVRLPVANSLVFTFTGISRTVMAFGQKHCLSDFGCKFVYCVHRVILYYIRVRCNYRRKLGECLYYLCTFMYICDYFKIKS